MSMGNSVERFDAEQFGVDIRVWRAVHQRSLRDVVGQGLPCSAANLSRLQRGVLQPHVGLFLALCDLMHLDPMAYFVKEGADDGPAE